MATPVIGIISMGEMGSGIAKLLRAHNYRVLACVEDRSEATKRRAASAGVDVILSNEALIRESDVLLSIVPPQDAMSTASIVRDTMENDTTRNRPAPLVFIDLNAISPASSYAITNLLRLCDMKFIDGGIIGGPPKQSVEGKDDKWTKPSLVVSGPVKLCDSINGGGELENVLNIKHVAKQIGSATGLKMCFASLSKGFTALAIQSFTTAYQLGVLDELKAHLHEFNPSAGSMAERGLAAMPPKAHRWIAEMEEISKTMRDEGGFDSHLFDEIAMVYQVIANHPILGAEKSGERVRGTNSQEVAALTAEALNHEREAL